MLWITDKPLALIVNLFRCLSLSTQSLVATPTEVLRLVLNRYLLKSILFFDDRMTLNRNRFLVNKTNRCTEFQFYWYYNSTCFGQPFCPSSGVLSRTSALVHFLQLWWPFAIRGRMELQFYPTPDSKRLYSQGTFFLFVYLLWTMHYTNQRHMKANYDFMFIQWSEIVVVNGQLDIKNLRKGCCPMWRRWLALRWPHLVTAVQGKYQV